VRLTDKSVGNFTTNKYNGFVQYIQNLNPEIKKLGVIHYSNPSPENVYGEGFFDNTPVLDIPYIMWHKSTGDTIGLKLTCGDEYTLSGLSTRYYDLVDQNGNILGKCFNELKLFVIEDQELLFAMSYKSNRSWTLPSFNLGFNTNINMGCPTCIITTDITTTNPTTINGDGVISITNINNTYGDILIIVQGQSSTGITKNINITSSDIVSSLPININVPIDTYDVKIYDLGAIGTDGKPCVDEYTNIIITNPTSILGIYDVEPIE